MPDPTQMLKINNKNYRGIKVKVNFKGSEEKIEESDESSLASLSGG
jgi:hypothetical protein